MLRKLQKSTGRVLQEHSTVLEECLHCIREHRGSIRGVLDELNQNIRRVLREWYSSAGMVLEEQWRSTTSPLEEYYRGARGVLVECWKSCWKSAAFIRGALEEY